MSVVRRGGQIVLKYAPETLIQSLSPNRVFEHFNFTRALANNHGIPQQVRRHIHEPDVNGWGPRSCRQGMLGLRKGRQDKMARLNARRLEETSAQKQAEAAHQYERLG